MAARGNKPNLFGIVVFVVALLAILGYSVKSGLFTTKTLPTGSKETPKPQTTESTTNVQAPVSGPVGRNGLRAYAGPGVGEVTLEWQRYAVDGENYNVHYGTKSGEYPFQATSIGYISTYTIKRLTPGTKYFFVVEGIRAGNVSGGWDGEVSMVAPSSPTVVVGTAGPIGRNLLAAKPGPGKGQVTLNWVRFFSDTEKYSIVYGTVPGVYSFGLLNAVDTTPQDNNYTYVIGALTSGTRYYFALDPQRNGTGIYITSEVSAVAP